MINYYVRVVPFPVGVQANGMILPNEDGTYSIYLNARATWEQQIKAFNHELEHIANDDFYNEKSIAEVEKNLPRA